MKRKEIAIIAVVAIVAAVISIIISDAIFGSPKKNPIKVPVVVKISSNFPLPQTDEEFKKFFNDQAIDPTQLIRIGDGNNQVPFQGFKQ